MVTAFSQEPSWSDAAFIERHLDVAATAAVGVSCERGDSNGRVWDRPKQMLEANAQSGLAPVADLSRHVLPLDPKGLGPLRVDRPTTRRTARQARHVRLA